MGTVWDNLVPFFNEAYSLKKALTPSDVVYSDHVYQVLFPGHLEEDRPCVVIQLDPAIENEGVTYQPQDLFCSSCDSSTQSFCVHQAASYLWMSDFGRAPPHIFFKHSSWKTLFENLCEMHGYEDFLVKSDGKILEIHRGKKAPFITIKADKQILEHIQDIFDSPQETEENSIKFSALDDDELERYRKGRPSRKLRFELSRLSDLAQYLSLVEQMAHDKASFSTQGEVKMGKDFLLEYQIQSVDWTALKEQLQEHDYNLISINKEAKSFEFQIGDKVDGKKIILKDPQQIALLLALVRPTLSSVHKAVSHETVTLEYDIEVFPDAIVLEPYRKKKGDLKDSVWFGSWVLSSKFGLFPISGTPFCAPLLRLEGREISSFIKKYPRFLSALPGSKVYHAPQEEKVLYKIEPSGALRFFSKTNMQKGHDVPSKKEAYDFGSYTWVKGKGFYPKDGSGEPRALPIGSQLAPYQVADFIRSHKEALEQLPDFFAAKSPLLKSGLQISLQSPDSVTVEPMLIWRKGVDSEAILMYDEFAYLEDVGFFVIPSGQTLLAQERTIEAAEPEEWDHFFESGLQKLTEEVHCEIDPQLLVPDSLSLVASDIGEQGLKERDVSVLWQMNLTWESEKGRVSLQEVIEGKSKGIRFLPTQAGLLDLTQDRFAWIESKKRKKKKLSDVKGGAAALERVELTSLELIRLHAHDNIRFEEGSGSYAPIELVERLLEMKAPQPPDTRLLNCNLRPYQEHGLNWLWYLYTNGLSGLLCDDMGVGKTHQAMALLASVKAEAERTNRRARFLVVCPTSLVWHWREKLEQFVPGIDIAAYFGTTRSDASIRDAEVLLTTYGIWRNERKNLQKLTFDVAIFDELQIAKNHSSLIWSALSDIQARMRLGLTGTPIENQLRELKALFDLILPGYMPDEHAFRELFIRPIEKGNLNNRRDLLGRYVRPFILRRRKQDVLQDLPQKSEEISHAELVGEQKTLYRSVAATHSASLLSALKDDASNVPYMHIFALLSALKQISNHPATYLKDVDNYPKYESGKWNIFQELIEEAQESGLKVVVFSQYLSMLDIMGKYLDSKGIQFAQVRGQTKRRGAEIARFQTDPECKVFLGSLQAAGLGIDLTAGSIVIHYDRWWNAARENQATDRVHRIGQARGVQVYKLVTIHSIEESIDRMIARKSSLLEDVVSWDDHQIVKKLSRSELIELLEGLQEG